MSYADEKAYLVAEIERMKAELVAENSEDSFQNLKNDFKTAQLQVLNEQASLIAELLNGKKIEGDELEVEMREHANFMDDSVN